MPETGGVERARWGVAAALLLAVLLISALDAVPLVTLPLAVVLLASPASRRWQVVALGGALCLVGVGLPGGPMEVPSRGWALLLGGAFLGVTLGRPGWGVLPRALAALAVTLVATGGWLAITGSWAEIDALVRERLVSASGIALRELRPRNADPAMLAEFRATAGRVAHLQWQLFPGLLALQSLAALAFGAWAASRVLREDGARFALRPLREFRFSDQLVWVLIAGLLLIALPLADAATRVGYNAVLFMGGLYALRGAGVFVYLVGGAPSALTVVFGALTAIFLYPLVLTAAILVGLGDTWLDVRGRAALAPRA